LRSTDAFQKTKLCRNLQFGKCSRGNKCHFAHSPAELKAPDMMASLQMPPGLDGLYGFADEDEDTTYVSGEGSRDSGSDGGGSDRTRSQKNRSFDPAYEPAYVHIGSDLTSIGSPIEDESAAFLTKGLGGGLGGYPYLSGTDLDYLAAFSECQGDWSMEQMNAMQQMSAMQDYVDALAGIGLNVPSGMSGLDWNSNLPEDKINTDKKAKSKKASTALGMDMFKMLN
jgi:hypothetical protein